MAEFLGGANLIEGVVDSREADGRCSISTGSGALRAAGAGPGAGAGGFARGERVLVAIRSEAMRIELSAGADGKPNSWPGVVRARAYRGDAVDHVVAVGDRELHVRSPASVTIAPGTAVTLSFGEEACVLVPADAR